MRSADGITPEQVRAWFDVAAVSVIIFVVEKQVVRSY